MTTIPIPETLPTEVPPSWTPSRHEPLLRDFSQLPVTALCFASANTQSLLLAAQDNGINIYDAATSEVVAHVPVFAEQTVHGISVCERRVLVWGSTYVAFFTLEDFKDGFQPDILRVDAPDWVYDAKSSPYDPSIAVLATAHNDVVRLKIDGATITIQETVSPARPILYAAQLTWLDSSSVLIAAGTAFGEILVWKYHVSHPHEMLFVFTGHEGSIYGVAISPLLNLPERAEPVRLLASCSDDRTVRIWDITEREEQRQKYDFSSARETGFSEILPNADQPKLEGGEPVAVGMGHLSRIWGVEIGDADEDGNVDIWTLGEDSTAWRWKLTLDGHVRGALTFEKTLSYHDGKHLWSHATMRAGEKGFLATGGADGRISLVETGDDSAAASGMVTFGCSQLCPEGIAKPVSKKKAEVFGRFEFLSADQILVTTSMGRLLLGMYVGDSLDWRPILAEGLQDEIKQCYVLKRVSNGTAVLGTTTGNVYFFKDDTLSLIGSFPKKVNDINILATNDSSVDLLIHIFGTACPTYISLNTQTGQILSRKQVTGLDDRFNCTSAGLLGPYIIMGSRHGWLSLLESTNDTYTQTLAFPSPTRDAITSIVALPVSPSSQPTLFLTTSRDGSYRIYTLSSPASIALIHHSSLPFGPMIESAFFTTSSPPHLILTGFRSQNFVVWNESLREERLSVECGGAHRSFALFHSSTDENVMRFTFNRAAKLSIHSQLRLEATPLKRGTHGREIRSVSYNGKYIATGGEDTSIRICEQHPRNRCLAYLTAHVSGLQKVKWLDRPTPRGHLLFSSAGNEEFFVWSVNPLSNTTYPGLAVVQEAVFDDKSPDGDLRIMDFDVEATACEENGVWARDGGVIVTMAFSSSVLARYVYHPTTGFRLLARGSYTGACLTQVKHLGDEVLTASTDGHIAVWTTKDDTFTIQQTVRVHQSSIKCLATISSGSQRYIITGGDDNALGITLLTPQLRVHGVVRNAHAAAINGLVARSYSEGRIEVVTVSNDQRLKTWWLEGPGERLRLTRDVGSGVADAGDVEDLSDGRFVVVGNGVEVWREGVRG